MSAGLQKKKERIRKFCGPAEPARKGNQQYGISDRVYICPDCGFEIDRDLNAAINLKNAIEYTIAS